MNAPHLPLAPSSAVQGFHAALAAGGTDTATALAIYDALEPIDTSFMLGAWTGAGFPTRHLADGVLETCHWHGKRFDSEEQVHPLLFRTLTGGIASVNPFWMLPVTGLLGRVRLPTWPALGRFVQLLIPLLRTRRGRARLRMTTYRGKTSATMAYDHLPIHDVFRKVDDNTVLGVMDLKGMPQPFFFILRRDARR